MKRNFTKYLLIFLLLFSFAICAVGCSGEDGKSAYEIALDNGFIGSENDWLESLKGENGLDGKDQESLSIYDIYLTYTESDSTITFDDFLNMFLNISYSSTEKAISEALQSSLSVVCKFEKTTKTGPFGNNTKTEEYYSAGSGVIYELNKETGDVIIITNYHVVYDSSSNTSDKLSNTISVYLYGNETSSGAIDVEFFGGSSTYDIAILKGKNDAFKNDYVKAVTFADSNNIVVGQNAIAIGNPAAEGISATSGIVSVDSETIEMTSITNSSEKVNMRVIRVDTAINSGNSGGGLFNDYGQLIGIVNAKIADTSIDNIGYAIPSNIVLNVIKNLLNNNGAVKKCLIGITTIIKESKLVYENGYLKIQETIEITDITSSSVADGNLMIGDIIVSASVNNNDLISITRNFQLSDYLLLAKVNDSLTLVVLRNGVEYSITLALTNISDIQ